jgi:hypothetical protein
MKAVLTLKPVTDKKGNVWHAGQILGMSSAQAKTFVVAKNGLDLEGTNFANAATPDNTAAAIAAPTTSDFSLAMLGVKPGSDVVVPPPVEQVTYVITATVDATDPMKYHFDAAPANAGTYNFGDGKPTANAIDGQMGHTFAAAGNYTVTFVPADGNKNGTVAITVVAPVAAAPEPTPEPIPEVTPEPTPVEETPAV